MQRIISIIRGFARKQRQSFFYSQEKESYRWHIDAMRAQVVWQHRGSL